MKNILIESQNEKKNWPTAIKVVEDIYLNEMIVPKTNPPKKILLRLNGDEVLYSCHSGVPKIEFLYNTTGIGVPDIEYGGDNPYGQDFIDGYYYLLRDGYSFHPGSFQSGGFYRVWFINSHPGSSGFRITFDESMNPSIYDKAGFPGDIINMIFEGDLSGTIDQVSWEGDTLFFDYIS